MKVFCYGCGAKYELTEKDVERIQILSSPETFEVKLNHFLCINCFNKEKAYQQEDNLLKAERQKLDLDVDK